MAPLWWERAAGPVVIDVLEEILKSQVVQIAEELIGDVVVSRHGVADEFIQFGFEFLHGEGCVKCGIVAARVHWILRRL